MQDTIPARERIAELEAELVELRKQESDAKEALRKSVKAEYKFTLTRQDEQKHQHNWGDPIWDDTITVLRIDGKILNEDALKEVGAMVPTQGGMDYLFNTATGKFVIAIGGGTWYCGDGRYSNDKTNHKRLMLDDLEHLIAGIPQRWDELDITPIVNAHRST
jgi:Ni,Fe-hydrogenase I small subunit